MRVILIGCGCGRETLTVEAAAEIQNSDLLIGSPRLLEEFPEIRAKIKAITAQEIRAALDGSSCERACVLFSGDSGFFSGAGPLLPLPERYDWKLLPGVSSLQLLSARIGAPWQDWKLCSAHGTECDPVAEICGGRQVFFLTGGKLGPKELCRRLCDAGLGSLKVWVGENLGGADERICQGSAKEFKEQSFAALSVMLSEAAPRRTVRTPGIPDTEFVRNREIPMTKQEVRAAALAKLGVRPEDTCWDIGTGTGSVAVELALHCSAVWAVERNPEAISLAKQNRERFGAWNLRLAEGSAPEALAELPVPNAVFVGGSGGRTEDILTAVHRANPEARICVSAIALETLHKAVQTLEALGLAVEVCQISVSRSRGAGDLTLMLAQNPVWLITGTPA